MKSIYFGLTILLLTVVALSACGSTVTPQSDSTPTPTFAATVPVSESTATLEPTATATETATLLPTPTNQGDCINRAEFVSDVTVPDNTNFQAGDKFIKTWRIRNTGSCVWNMRYALIFLQGSQMSAPYSTPLVETVPGSTLDVSLELVAPAQDGAFSGTYQFQSPSHQRFGVKGGNLWVKIVVGSGTSAPSTPTGTPDANSLSMTPTIETPSSALTGTPTIRPTITGQNGSCTYLQNPDFVAQVLVLINQARATNGLPAYTLNSELSAAAMKHSIDMGCNNLLQHTGSDGSTPQTRVAAEGYSATSLQEAIYAQPPQFGGTPQTAVDWWLNDSQHRPILLSSTLTEIGIGYVSVPASNLGGYFTINVATP